MNSIIKQTNYYNEVSKEKNVGLKVIGYYLDVVSLTKASMVSRLWRSIFGNHPNWEKFYLTSKEYCMLANPRIQGPWKILYGELFNRCSALMYNAWKKEEHLPAQKNFDDIRFICENFHFFNDKLVIQGMGKFLLRSDQIPSQRKEELGSQSDFLLKVHPKYTKVNLPEKDKEVQQIFGSAVNNTHLYASSSSGKIFCWKRNEFPFGCSQIIQEEDEYQNIACQNDVIYLFTSKHISAQRDSKKLWKIQIEHSLHLNLNNNLGAFIDFNRDALIGDLYLWDTQKPSEPIKIKNIKNFVLLEEKAVCLTEEGIIAHSLKGSEMILKIDYHLVTGMLPNQDQNQIYLFTEGGYLSTLCIDKKEEISKIDLGNMQWFCGAIVNGIIYAVDIKGRLLLIHPKKGVIRTGTSKMFAPGTKLTVHQGTIYGINWDRSGVVAVSSTERKTLKNKLKDFKDRF